MSRSSANSRVLLRGFIPPIPFKLFETKSGECLRLSSSPNDVSLERNFKNQF